MTVRFHKYSALGNDYLVLAQPMFTDHLTESNVRHVCDVANGPGADGVLAAVDEPGAIRIRIWNADGSTAEKSGNGLRIFARYLWDQRQIDERPVRITTDVGDVQAEVLDGGKTVCVEMGQVTFPAGTGQGATRWEPMKLVLDGNRQLDCFPAAVGNPHCVCFVDSPTADLARSLGPVIERHPAFPHRTNVQFISVRSRSEIRMEVWERGSGYTLSSGTSAIAAVAVSHRRGLVEQAVSVMMPGGTLAVTVDDDYFASIQGAVEKFDEQRDTYEFPDSLFA